MLKEFINRLKELSMKEEYIKSVIIVGSYARGINKEDSDLDLCIITTQENSLLLFFHIIVLSQLIKMK